MVLVRLRHEGQGIYRYGLPGKPIGRLRLNQDTGWPEQLESIDLGLNPDPYVTAGAAIRWHWRQHYELPEMLEVVQSQVLSAEPKRVPPDRQPPVRQGRLRQVSGRPMSVAEIAARGRLDANRLGERAVTTVTEYPPEVRSTACGLEYGTKSTS